MNSSVNPYCLSSCSVNFNFDMDQILFHCLDQNRQLRNNWRNANHFLQACHLAIVSYSSVIFWNSRYSNVEEVNICEHECKDLYRGSFPGEITISRIQLTVPLQKVLHVCIISGQYFIQKLFKEKVAPVFYVICVLKCNPFLQVLFLFFSVLVLPFDLATN